MSLLCNCSIEVFTIIKTYQQVLISVTEKNAINLCELDNQKKTLFPLINTVISLEYLYTKLIVIQH
jgi:hypothetical protein